MSRYLSIIKHPSFRLSVSIHLILMQNSQTSIAGTDYFPKRSLFHLSSFEIKSMPSCSPSSQSLPQPPKHDLSAILDAARPFLRGELQSVDSELPSLVSTLRAVGAGECWHKHGSFLSHLVDVYRVLKLWGAPDSVARCGLYHSAYSNSYVNLAIFDPATSRNDVGKLIGDHAERLVHLFCVVPRQSLIHDDLLFRYSSDEELRDHLLQSAISLRAAKEDGNFDRSEPWRQKLESVLPAEGVAVKHIKTGEDLRISRRIVAAFLLMTMADFSDQLFDFQDSLFSNTNGRLEFAGNNYAALWPGNGKPGLWLNSISRMGALYALIAREEEIFSEERKQGLTYSDDNNNNNRDEDIELVVPPVFEGCTKVLDPKEQMEARELYWEAVCGGDGLGLQKAEELLVGSREKNPYVGEPHVVLAQVYMGMEKYEEAEKEAEKGVRLLLEWGSSWDKRMAWEGWVAWGRVLLMKAKERSWPHTSWGILNLGLVR